MFALADVNAMYCSCERIFRPDLRNTPIVVLSNNDGCVIAQTKEIKALGIHMAQPWFEVEKQARAMGVVDFSSNYELYANMSNRFADTLRHFTPRLEVYSIDECFLDLTGFTQDLVAYGHEIKNTVLQWTKLPICVGIGHSKTLCKLANKVAKKQERFNGVCDFTSMSEAEVDAIMENMEVTKVWGVGSRNGAKLEKLGVNNILRLKRADPKRIRDRFGVVLERTVKELNGEVWLGMQDGPQPAQQVMSSRSFGARVSTLADLRQAVSYHASNAAERMRRQGLYTNAVHCFIQNSQFDQAQYYGRSLTMGLPGTTDCTIKIIDAALCLLNQMYAPGVYYQKAGVMLMQLVPDAGQQTDIFGYSASKPKSNALMHALDSINKQHGRGTLRVASEGINKSWAMRRSFKSPNYTTDWKAMPVIGKSFA